MRMRKRTRKKKKRTRKMKKKRRNRRIYWDARKQERQGGGMRKFANPSSSLPDGDGGVGDGEIEGGEMKTGRMAPIITRRWNGGR